MVTRSNHSSRTDQADEGAPSMSELLAMLQRNPELAMMLAAPPIMFHRAFVDITGSATAALLLSACLQEAQDIGTDAQGWFVTSGEMWTQRTGLSRKEQATARKVLRDADLLQERRSGFPAALEVRIMFDKVSCQLMRVAAQREAHHESTAASASSDPTPSLIH